MNLHLLINALVISFTIHLVFETGFIQSLEDLLSRLFFKSKISVKLPKPFSCDFCLSFWAIAIYLFCNDFEIIYLMIVSLVFAWLGQIAFPMVQIIIELLNIPINVVKKLIRIVEKWIL